MFSDCFMEFLSIIEDHILECLNLINFFLLLLNNKYNILKSNFKIVVSKLLNFMC